MPDTLREPKADAPQRRLVRRGPAIAPAAAPAPVAQAIRSPGRGAPLHPAVRRPLAHSLGVDVAPVRVHTDPAAAAATRAVGARAFAYGTDVFLAQGERPTDLPLIAHEVAHVVQQQAAPAPQAFTASGVGLEREAHATAAAVSQGEPATVEGRTGGPQVQGLLGFIVDWLEDKVWDALEHFAPVLVPIVRKGFWGWLKDKISEAFEAFVDVLMAPVTLVTGLIASVSSHFAKLVAWVKEAAAEIASGDCSSITRAARKIQDVVMGFASPVIEKVQDWLETAKAFFSGLWERFGAPVMDFFAKVGGAIWDTIKNIAAWIWDKTEPIRDWLARAWRWIKNKLGIGEGTEGKNGILQWVEEKLSLAWEWFKEKIEPYKKAILVVLGVVAGLTLGPILAIPVIAAGLIYGVRWIIQHLNTRGSVVDQRGVLEREVIPRIMGAVQSVGAKVRGIAGWLTDKLGSLVGGLGRAAGRLAGSILKFLVFALNWLIGIFKDLLAWAVEKVQAVADWIASAIERLRTFLEPILEVVRWIGRVIADILNLVSGVIKRIWNKIPPCIRDPIKSFLINQILKRIPIFNKLLEIKDIWDKVKGAALNVIRDIFVKWDIKAAVLHFFELILTILEIPLDLVKSIYTKARAAFSEIVKDPLGFLRNALKAAWEGFGIFFDKIATHLWEGVLGWFRGQMKKAGIEVPTEFTFKAILGMIFSIAGISVEKLFEILEKRLKNKPLVAKIRKFYKLLTGVWEWVSVAIEQGALALWEKIKQTAGDLWDALVTALVGWVTKEVVKLASPRLLAALNPVGAIINAILGAWAAIQTAAEYARQILEIVNSVLDTALDLARGVTGRAAEIVDKALAAAIPVAVGFLANFLRLGNLGERVKEMLAPIQKKVEEGIGAIIDVAISAGRAILDRLGLGGAAKDEVSFDAGGESHRLFAEGEGPTEEVWLESTRRTAAGWVDYWEKNDLPELPRPEDREQSKLDIKSARSLLTRRRQSKETKLSEVADVLKKLFQMFGHPSAKPTVLFFRGNADSKSVRGGFAKAEPLTLKFPEGGDRPSSSTSAPVPGEQRMAQMNRATQKWVKLHMIHFDLGGPDKSQNFAIGDKDSNTNMYNRAEKKVIDLLTGHAKGALTLWYETKAEYRTGKNIDFLKAITAEWGNYDVKNDKREKSLSGVLSFDSGAPDKRDTSVVINDDGVDSLEVIGELERRFATIVRDAARAAPQRMSSLKQLEKAVAAVRPSFAQDQINEVVDAVRTGLQRDTLTWEP